MKNIIKYCLDDVCMDKLVSFFEKLHTPNIDLLIQPTESSFTVQLSATSGVTGVLPQQNHVINKKKKKKRKGKTSGIEKRISGTRKNTSV